MDQRARLRSRIFSGVGVHIDLCSLTHTHTNNNKKQTIMLREQCAFSADKIRLVAVQYIHCIRGCRVSFSPPTFNCHHLMSVGGVRLNRRLLLQTSMPVIFCRRRGNMQKTMQTSWSERLIDSKLSKYRYQSQPADGRHRIERCRLKRKMDWSYVAVFCVEVHLKHNAQISVCLFVLCVCQGCSSHGRTKRDASQKFKGGEGAVKILDQPINMRNLAILLQQMIAV